MLGAKPARNLGIDHAEGLRAARPIRQQRPQACKARAPKIARFPGLKRGRQAAAKVAFTGLLPSALYGVNCMGLNTAELSQARTLVRRAVEAHPKGKSLTAALMLTGAKC